ncbi:MAG: PD40 domain-containing protein [Verrucomicrobia bacterium]|nr:PD40 domain-containing protein [Verrucomicrobiota bacterium]
MIVFTEFWGTGLFRVSAEGGEVSPLTTLNTAEHEGVHLWPHFLPDGRHFLFLVRCTQPESSFIWVGALDSKETRRRLIQADALVGWLDLDQVLFARGGALYVQTFDAKQLAFAGAPRMVTDSVAYISQDSEAKATCSRNGILAYKADPYSPRQLTWLDRTGQPAGPLGPPMMLRFFRLSPDEQSVAVAKFDRRAGTWNLWQVGAATGTEDRLTFLRNAQMAVWSPDGSEIIYDSDEFTMFNLYRRRADRTTPEQPIYRTATDDKRPSDWSSDGRHVLFQQVTEKNGWDIWLISLDDPSHPQPLIRTEADEKNASFSPDARWIAYNSEESGRAQVYVQPFPKGGSRVLVSRDGGEMPVWNPNGKELFFLDPERTLMSVEIKTDDSGVIKLGVPKALFRRPANVKSPIEGYDVSRDGQRFLFALDAPSPGFENITVLLNWLGEAKR